MRGLDASASTGKLSTRRWAELDAEFQKLARRDVESLTAVSRSKSRHITHQLAYREKPLPEAEVKARVAKATQRRANSVASLEDLPKLDRILQDDPEAIALREIVRNRKRIVAEDLTTSLLKRSEASLDWVDVAGLDAGLDDEEVDECSEPDDIQADGSPPPRWTVQRGSDAGLSPSSPGGAMSSAADGTSPGSPLGYTGSEPRVAGLSSRWLGSTRHAALQRRRWPSEARFDRHYKVPADQLPPGPPVVKPESLPLPAPRKTIASLEETSGFGAQAYLWPALLEAREFKDRRASGQRTSSVKPLDAANAAELYLQACQRYQVEPVAPLPTFGECVEVKGVIVESTRQCYALAEAVQSCAARAVFVGDAFLTDTGAAKIVESALAGGRLQRLCLSGSPLSYATCVALHDALRTRAGASLAELSLSSCGLGADLDVEPAALVESFANAYARADDLLQRVISALEEKERELAGDLDATLPANVEKPQTALKSSGGLDGSRSASAPTLKLAGSSSRAVGSQQQADSGMDARQPVQDSEEPGEIEEPAAPPTPLLLPVFGMLAQPSNTLKKLDLSRTFFSGTSVEYLSKMLRTSPLEVLVLNDCGLDDECISHIGDGLASNRSLLELHLRCNAFCSDGNLDAISKLLDSASRHVRLAHLDLAETDLPGAISDQICSLLCWSASLVSLHLLGAGVHGAGAQELLEACLRWTHENATEEHLRPSAEAQSPSAGGSGSQDAFGAEETVTYSLGGLSHGASEVDAVAEEVLAAFRHSGVLAATEGDASQIKVRPIAGTSLVHVTAGTQAIEEIREMAAGISLRGTHAEFVEELVICRAMHVLGLADWRVVTPVPKKIIKPTDVYQNSGAADPADVAKQAMAASVPSSWMPACCWIQAKCPNVEIRWCVPDRGPGEDAGGGSCRIFARPSFADFARVELKRLRMNGARRVYYSSQFLVPHGTHCYVLEIEIDGQSQFLCSQDHASVEMADAPLNSLQREELARVCRQNRYQGRLNVLAPVSGEGFVISEQIAEEGTAKDSDPWADDPARKGLLRECYEADLGVWNFCDLCHIDEEPAVRKTLWDIYWVLFEIYSIFAGRSQFPLVRQVDMYGFFEEARLLKKSGPSAGGHGPSSPPCSPQQRARSSSVGPPLTLQDVQQLIIQTIQQRNIQASGGGSRGGQRRSSIARRAETLQQRQQEGAPLTRPQFMEVLLRAALALRGRQTDTSECFSDFAEKVLRGRVMRPPLSQFPRGLLLQAGEVSDAMLAHRNILREAWERFGGSENNFQRLAQLLRLCDRSFTAKHMASIFALARRPRVLCAPSAQRRGVAFDEFCETILRLALIARKPAKPGEDPSKSPWPPQPQPGRQFRQRAVATRFNSFVVRLKERMRPAVYGR